jgi:hypothetical protein
MKSPFVIAALCAAMLSTAGAHAEQVCGLDALKNEYLSVRIEPGSAIEVSRVPADAFVAVVEPAKDGWIKISYPGHPPDGWVPAEKVCPGPPR